jgi:hypothetical protein
LLTYPIILYGNTKYYQFFFENNREEKHTALSLKLLPYYHRQNGTIRQVKAVKWDTTAQQMLQDAHAKFSRPCQCKSLPPFTLQILAKLYLTKISIGTSWL